MGDVKGASSNPESTSILPNTICPHTEGMLGLSSDSYLLHV
jgi:hypothetical protein